MSDVLHYLATNLWWPIPALIIAGAVMCAAGAWRRGRR